MRLFCFGIPCHLFVNGCVDVCGNGKTVAGESPESIAESYGLVKTATGYVMA
jgi:hypothetical protein